ncbi:MAG: 1,4-dihydroxy-6-naphthoate synthase [Chitinophagaceae bacterium]|nr:1,4-dihydroxy-6-naphthoate synthase [Chitinophagaceae bacterium]
MKLTIGISPCPNDTFIFDAFVNNKLDTGGIETEVILADVETLNQWALEGKLDITKLSYPAFFNALETYELLNAGAALGKGVGPLLIAKEYIKIDTETSATVAVPGIYTTANFLLECAYPQLKNKKPFLFSEIEDAVLTGQTDLGVIIHENRFTYQQKGLIKIADLGSIWEEKMNAPIPLGGIAIKRNLDQKIKWKIDEWIRKSVKLSFSNYPVISDYVKQHAQEMSEDVMRQHIDLYVNNYSIDLGEDGQKAIKLFYDVFLQKEKTEKNANRLFLID